MAFFRKLASIFRRKSEDTDTVELETRKPDDGFENIQLETKKSEFNETVELQRRKSSDFSEIVEENTTRKSEEFTVTQELEASSEEQVFDYTTNENDTLKEISSYETYEAPVDFYTLPDEMLILLDSNPTIDRSSRNTRTWSSSSSSAHDIRSFETFANIEEIPHSLKSELSEDKVKSIQNESPSDSFELEFQVDYKVFNAQFPNTPVRSDNKVGISPTAPPAPTAPPVPTPAVPGAATAAELDQETNDPNAFLKSRAKRNAVFESMFKDADAKLNYRERTLKRQQSIQLIKKMVEKMSALPTAQLPKKLTLHDEDKMELPDDFNLDDWKEFQDEYEKQQELAQSGKDDFETDLNRLAKEAKLADQMESQAEVKQGLVDKLLGKKGKVSKVTEKSMRAKYVSSLLKPTGIEEDKRESDAFDMDIDQMFKSQFFSPLNPMEAKEKEDAGGRVSRVSRVSRTSRVSSMRPSMLTEMGQSGHTSSFRKSLKRMSKRASGRLSTRHSSRHSDGFSTMSKGSTDNLLTIYGMTESDLDLVTTDYKTLKRYKLWACQCKPISMFIPVNTKAARAQYVEMRQGHLIKLEMGDMCLYTVPPHLYENQKILKLTEIFMSTLKHILAFGPKDLNPNLKYYQFVLLLLFHEINIISQRKTYGLLLKLGTVPGSIFLLFQAIFMDAPMMMFILTMTSYSRLMYLSFFKSMPLFIGLGYIMLVILFILSGGWTVIVEMSLQWFILHFGNIYKWLRCSETFDNFDHGCIPYRTNVTHNMVCSPENNFMKEYEYFSLQYRFRYHRKVLYQGWQVDGYMEYIKIGSAIFVWLYIFGTGVAGFYRTKKALLNLIMCCYITLFFSYFLIVTYRNYYSDPFYDWNKIRYSINPKFLVNLLMTATKFEMMPYLVWVSTMAPERFDPEICVMSVIGIKMIWIIISSAALEMCLYYIEITYKINPYCLIVDALDVIFLMVPHFFIDSAFMSLYTFCWLMVVMIMIFINQTFLVQMLIATLSQKFPKIRSIHLIFSLGLCILLCGIQLLHYKRTIAELLVDAYDNEFTNCTLVGYCLFILGLNFSYSWIRYSDDYLFTYGTRPNRFWKIWLSVMSLFCVVLIILLVTTETYRVIINNIFTLSLLFVYILISFTIIWIMQLVCRNIFHNTLHLILVPSRQWLPYNETLAQVRNYYVRSRDIRVKYASLTCDHFCLRLSKQYQTLVTRQKTIKQLMLVTRKRTMVQTDLLKFTTQVRKRSLFFRRQDAPTLVVDIERRIEKHLYNADNVQPYQRFED